MDPSKCHVSAGQTISSSKNTSTSVPSSPASSVMDDLSRRQSWAESMSNLLRDEEGAVYWVEFLREDGGDDYADRVINAVKFWNAVNGFRIFPDQEVKKARNALFRRYFDNGKINLDHSIVNPIKEYLLKDGYKEKDNKSDVTAKNHVNPSTQTLPNQSNQSTWTASIQMDRCLFDRAQLEVENYILTAPYLNFLKSDAYIALINEANMNNLTIGESEVTAKSKDHVMKNVNIKQQHSSHPFLDDEIVNPYVPLPLKNGMSIKPGDRPTSVSGSERSYPVIDAGLINPCRVNAPFDAADQAHKTQRRLDMDIMPSLNQSQVLPHLRSSTSVSSSQSKVGYSFCPPTNSSFDSSQHSKLLQQQMPSLSSSRSLVDQSSSVCGPSTQSSRMHASSYAASEVGVSRGLLLDNQIRRNEALTLTAGAPHPYHTNYVPRVMPSVEASEVSGATVSSGHASLSQLDPYKPISKKERQAVNLRMRRNVTDNANVILENQPFIPRTSYAMNPATTSRSITLLHKRANMDTLTLDQRKEDLHKAQMKLAKMASDHPEHFFELLKGKLETAMIKIEEKKRKEEAMKARLKQIQQQSHVQASPVETSGNNRQNNIPVSSRSREMEQIHQVLKIVAEDESAQDILDSHVRQCWEPSPLNSGNVSPPRFLHQQVSRSAKHSTIPRVKAIKKK